MMIQEIKDAFKANLPSLEWMDEPTRKAAVLKVKAVNNINNAIYMLSANRTVDLWP